MAATSWVAVPHRAAVARATFFAAVPIPQGRNSCGPISASTQRTKQTSLQSFPRKNIFLPFFAHLCVSLLPRCSARELFARAARGRSIARCPRRLLRPFHKQKNAGPRHYAANPLTTKSVDFSLKKTHVGTPGLHALASAARTYSLTARIRCCPFSFLLFYKGKEKRKQKQIQQVRIHRSDSLRSSSRCTRLARRASSAEIYVAIATRFVRDCVEDLAPLAASMERIPKCSWHIKDHYPGVNKASHVSPLLLRSFFLLKSFPTKI